MLDSIVSMWLVAFALSLISTDFVRSLPLQGSSGSVRDTAFDETLPHPISSTMKLTSSHNSGDYLFLGFCDTRRTYTCRESVHVFRKELGRFRWLQGWNSCSPVRLLSDIGEYSRSNTNTKITRRGFGSSIAASLQSVAIGSPLEPVDIGGSFGVVGMYQRSTSGHFTHLSDLVNPFPSESTLFGVSLAMDNSFLVVGAVSDVLGDKRLNSRHGLVYIFSRKDIYDWDLVEVLRQPDASFDGEFGASIVLKYPFLWVASPGADIQGAENTGILYGFQMHEKSPSVLKHSKSLNSAISSARFGSGMAMDSNSRLFVKSSLGIHIIDTSDIYTDESSSIPTLYKNLGSSIISNNILLRSEVKQSGDSDAFPVSVHSLDDTDFSGIEEPALVSLDSYYGILSNFCLREHKTNQDYFIRVAIPINNLNEGYYALDPISLGSCMAYIDPFSSTEENHDIRSHHNEDIDSRRDSVRSRNLFIPRPAFTSLGALPQANFLIENENTQRKLNIKFIFFESHDENTHYSYEGEHMDIGRFTFELKADMPVHENYKTHGEREYLWICLDYAKNTSCMYSDRQLLQMNGDANLAIEQTPERHLSYGRYTFHYCSYPAEYIYFITCQAEVIDIVETDLVPLSIITAMKSDETGNTDLVLQALRAHSNATTPVNFKWTISDQNSPISGGNAEGRTKSLHSNGSIFYISSFNLFQKNQAVDVFMTRVVTGDVIGHSKIILTNKYLNVDGQLIASATLLRPFEKFLACLKTKGEPISAQKYAYSFGFSRRSDSAVIYSQIDSHLPCTSMHIPFSSCNDEGNNTCPLKIVVRLRDSRENYRTFIDTLVVRQNPKPSLSHIYSAVMDAISSEVAVEHANQTDLGHHISIFTSALSSIFWADVKPNHDASSSEETNAKYIEELLQHMSCYYDRPGIQYLMTKKQALTQIELLSQLVKHINMSRDCQMYAALLGLSHTISDAFDISDGHTRNKGAQEGKLASCERDKLCNAVKKSKELRQSGQNGQRQKQEAGTSGHAYDSVSFLAKLKYTASSPIALPLTAFSLVLFVGLCGFFSRIFRRNRRNVIVPFGDAFGPTQSGFEFQDIVSAGSFNPQPPARQMHGYNHSAQNKSAMDSKKYMSNPDGTS